MNYEIGPILTMPDPLHPGFTYKIWNPRFKEKPAIVSFTQILKENYVAEYGRYIRNKISRRELPVPCMGRYEILNVAIDRAFYDKLDCDSFAMYVICEVCFYDYNSRQEVFQKYYVTGYHSFHGISDYLTDSDIYIRDSVFTCIISWMTVLFHISVLQAMIPMRMSFF